MWHEYQRKRLKACQRRRLRINVVRFCCYMLMVHCSLALGENTEKEIAIKVSAGQTADLWLGVNVTGKVYYTIRTRDRSNEMRLWWIKNPFGRVEQLGIRRNAGSLDIPAKLNGVVFAKLRGKANTDTVIYLREGVAVDNSATFVWP